jgi:hypothetical protein
MARDELEDPEVPLVDGVVANEGVVDVSRARRAEEAGGEPLDELATSEASRPDDDLEVDDDPV